jgi:hypothetical protein
MVCVLCVCVCVCVCLVCACVSCTHQSMHIRKRDPGDEDSSRQASKISTHTSTPARHPLYTPPSTTNAHAPPTQPTFVTRATRPNRFTPGRVSGMTSTTSCTLNSDGDAPAAPAAAPAPAEAAAAAPFALPLPPLLPLPLVAPRGGGRLGGVCVVCAIGGRGGGKAVWLGSMGAFFLS